MPVLVLVHVHVLVLVLVRMGLDLSAYSDSRVDLPLWGLVVLPSRFLPLLLLLLRWILVGPLALLSSLVPGLGV